MVINLPKNSISFWGNYKGTKVGIHYFSNRLDDKSMLKSLIGFLPLLTCLWMIANGENSVMEGLALAGVSLAGAIVSKAIVSCANKFIFFPVKKE